MYSDLIQAITVILASSIVKTCIYIPCPPWLTKRQVSGCSTGVNETLNIGGVSTPGCCSLILFIVAEYCFMSAPVIESPNRSDLP